MDKNKPYGGTIDITDKIPPLCLRCPQQDFVVTTGTLRGDDGTYIASACVYCRNEDICASITAYLTRQIGGQK